MIALEPFVVRPDVYIDPVIRSGTGDAPPQPALPLLRLIHVHTTKEGSSTTR